MVRFAVPAVEHLAVVGLEPELIDGFALDAVVRRVPRFFRLVARTEQLSVAEDAAGYVEGEDSEPSGDQRRRRRLCEAAMLFRAPHGRHHFPPAELMEQAECPRILREV